MRRETPDERRDREVVEWKGVHRERGSFPGTPGRDKMLNHNAVVWGEGKL